MYTNGRKSALWVIYFKFLIQKHVAFNYKIPQEEKQEEIDIVTHTTHRNPPAASEKPE